VKLPTRKVSLIRTGKRKTAIARAVLKLGSGRVTVNKIPVELYTPEVARLKVMEPLMLTGDQWKQLDIAVSVKGGGFMGQAEAVQMSIARGLVDWFKTVRVRKVLQSYDRIMLAGDPRRKEMKKFGGSGARARKQKSYR